MEVVIGFNFDLFNSGMSSNNQAQNLAAQMQFGPLLYSYQLAMAQAAAAAQQQQAPSTKGKCKFPS